MPRYTAILSPPSLYFTLLAPSPTSAHASPASTKQQQRKAPPVLRSIPFHNDFELISVSPPDGARFRGPFLVKNSRFGLRRKHPLPLHLTQTNHLDPLLCLSPSFVAPLTSTPLITNQTEVVLLDRTVNASLALNKFTRHSNQNVTISSTKFP
jgi:hypothetical protein